jgi:hypothetical protein
VNPAETEVVFGKRLHFSELLNATRQLTLLHVTRQLTLLGSPLPDWR